MHQGNVISTPAVKGTILPGITRKSIIDVALSKGFQVITCRSHELRNHLGGWLLLILASMSLLI